MLLGRFSRSIILPFPVQNEHATATLDHGILTVFLPKSPQQHGATIPVTVPKPLFLNYFFHHPYIAFQRIVMAITSGLFLLFVAMPTHAITLQEKDTLRARRIKMRKARIKQRSNLSDRAIAIL